jgi:hypothetical protein
VKIDEYNGRNIVSWSPSCQRFFFSAAQLPLFTVLSFCFVVPPILKRIVNEKETGVKVSVLGLPGGIPIFIPKIPILVYFAHQKSRLGYNLHTKTTNFGLL